LAQEWFYNKNGKVTFQIEKRADLFLKKIFKIPLRQRKKALKKFEIDESKIFSKSEYCLPNA